MKKIIVLFVAPILMLSCTANQSQQAQVVPTHQNIIENRICNYKNIAFIGGSITVGAGASEKSKSYASKVGQWFVDNCPNDSIKNISIGGTGSDFAVYRLEHDLDGFVPDIAFYEFAVNDGGRQPDDIKHHVEALIYKLRRMNPEMLIFSVITTKGNHMEFYKGGIFPPAVDIHIQVASNEHIPVINVGQNLWAYVIKNNEEIEEYLPDGVHPNDLGYQHYYESIVQFLDSYFNMPTEQYSGDLANATLIDMSQATSTGCEKIKKNGEFYFLCDKGDKFSASFSGNLLGIVGSIRSDGGRLDCIVDASLTSTLDFWDNYALSCTSQDLI